MTKELSRNILNICIVLLVFTVMAVPLLNGNGMNEPQSTSDKSMIWGWWPLVPWDNRPVTESAWSDVLNQPIDLSRRGKPGDSYRYKIKRINLSLNRQGKVVHRMVAEGELSRTLLREAEPGIWVERFEWERFAAAGGTGPMDYPSLQELPKARGISFEFSPRTFDYVNPPADFARVENEAVGFLLKVLTQDAAGWDGILKAIRDEFGNKVHIGDTFRQTKWEPWDITPVEDKDSAGSYKVGEMQVSVVGLTRFSGEPCVLIWVSMEGNDVTQKMDTPQVALNMKSTEYFRGEIAASLIDGRLVAMEIWGPLPVCDGVEYRRQAAHRTAYWCDHAAGEHVGNPLCSEEGKEKPVRSANPKTFQSSLRISSRGC